MTLIRYSFPLLILNWLLTAILLENLLTLLLIFLTNCITTELGESDKDGLLVEDVTFEATRGPSGSDEGMKIAFM